VRHLRAHGIARDERRCGLRQQVGRGGNGRGACQGAAVHELTTVHLKSPKKTQRAKRHSSAALCHLGDAFVMFWHGTLPANLLSGGVTIDAKTAARLRASTHHKNNGDTM